MESPARKSSPPTGERDTNKCSGACKYQSTVNYPRFATDGSPSFVQWEITEFPPMCYMRYATHCPTEVEYPSEMSRSVRSDAKYRQELKREERSKHNKATKQKKLGETEFSKRTNKRERCIQKKCKAPKTQGR